MFDRSSLPIPIVLTGICLATQGSAYAQPSVQEQSVRPLGIPGETSEITPQVVEPSPVFGPTSVEMEEVERLARAGAWENASLVVTDLSAKYPGWSVPADLRRRLKGGLRNTRIASAISASDWQRALDLLGARQDEFCDDEYGLWARVDALGGLKDQDALKDLYMDALEECVPEMRPDILLSATGNLDISGLKDISELPLFDAQASVETTEALIAIRMVLLEREFHVSLSAGNFQAAADMAVQSGRPVFLRQVAWELVELDPAYATSLFEAAEKIESTPEGRYGQALALRNAGQFKVALSGLQSGEVDFADYSADVQSLQGLLYLDLARQAEEMGQIAEARQKLDKAIKADPALIDIVTERRGNLLLFEASAALDAGDYDRAKALAKAAQKNPFVQAAATEQLAWAELNGGNASEAFRHFEELYLSDPGEARADGLVLSAKESGNLEQLAKQEISDGLLTRKINTLRSDDAFAKGKYHIALALAPDRYPKLFGIDGLAFRQSVSVRQQDDGSASGEVDSVTLRSSLLANIGYAIMDAGIVAIDLRGADNAAASLPEEGAFWSPYISLATEGDVSLVAELGTTPIGASIDPAFIGKFVAARQTEGLFLEGSVYREGRRDSILSLVGTSERPGQEEFGRILETGAEVAFRRTVSGNYTLGGHGGTSSLEGENTAPNTKLDGRLGLTRDIRLDGFSYLNTGPFFQYQTYDHNLNANTAGYGGYFSPQVFTQSGWSLNFMTDELQDSLYRGDISASYQRIEEDPLYFASPANVGSNSSAISGSIDLAAGFRVTGRWIVSAHISGVSSNAFNDVQAGFALKYTPDGRAGLVRSDLEPDPFANDLWGR